jgi:two-component sensor histidine kinase
MRPISILKTETRHVRPYAHRLDELNHRLKNNLQTGAVNSIIVKGLA